MIVSSFITLVENGLSSAKCVKATVLKDTCNKLCKKISAKELESSTNSIHDILIAIESIGRSCNEDLFEKFYFNGLEDLYIKKLFSIITEQSCKSIDTDNLSEKLLESVISLSECSTKGKLEMIQKYGTLCFDLLIQSEGRYQHSHEVLRDINILLESCPVVLKESLMKSVNFSEKLKRLAVMLETSGDYEFQVGLVECFFRVIPRGKREEILKYLFNNKEVSKCILEIRDSEFETDCRQFLNKFNSKLNTRRSVISLPCSVVFLGDKELLKPSDPGYDYFWVDFNTGSQRISLFCQQSYDSQGTFDDQWETVSIWKTDVSLYDVILTNEFQVVNISLIKPIAEIFSSQQNVAGKVFQVQFSRELNVEEALTLTFGNGTAMKESKSRKVSAPESPIVIQRSPNEETFEVETESIERNTDEMMDVIPGSQSQNSNYGHMGRKVSIPRIPMSTPLFSKSMLHKDERINDIKSDIRQAEETESTVSSSLHHSKVSEPIERCSSHGETENTRKNVRASAGKSDMSLKKDLEDDIGSIPDSNPSDDVPDTRIPEGDHQHSAEDDSIKILEKCEGKGFKNRKKKSSKILTKKETDEKEIKQKHECKIFKNKNRSTNNNAKTGKKMEQQNIFKTKSTNPNFIEKESFVKGTDCYTFETSDNEEYESKLNVPGKISKEKLGENHRISPRNKTSHTSKKYKQSKCAAVLDKCSPEIEFPSRDTSHTEDYMAHSKAKALKLNGKESSVKQSKQCNKILSHNPIPHSDACTSSTNEDVSLRTSKHKTAKVGEVFLNEEFSEIRKTFECKTDDENRVHNGKESTINKNDVTCQISSNVVKSKKQSQKTDKKHNSSESETIEPMDDARQMEMQEIETAELDHSSENINEENITSQTSIAVQNPKPVKDNASSKTRKTRRGLAQRRLKATKDKLNKVTDNSQHSLTGNQCDIESIGNVPAKHNVNSMESELKTTSCKNSNITNTIEDSEKIDLVISNASNIQKDSPKDFSHGSIFSENTTKTKRRKTGKLTENESNEKTVYDSFSTEPNIKPCSVMIEKTNQEVVSTYSNRHKSVDKEKEGERKVHEKDVVGNEKLSATKLVHGSPYHVDSSGDSCKMMKETRPSGYENMRKSVLFYMSYSASKSHNKPTPAGDAEYDPYDFDAECAMQSTKKGRKKDSSGLFYSKNCMQYTKESRVKKSNGNICTNKRKKGQKKNHSKSPSLTFQTSNINKHASKQNLKRITPNRLKDFTPDIVRRKLQELDSIEDQQKLVTEEDIDEYVENEMKSINSFKGIFNATQENEDQDKESFEKNNVAGGITEMQSPLSDMTTPKTETSRALKTDKFSSKKKNNNLKQEDVLSNFSKMCQKIIGGEKDYNECIDDKEATESQNEIERDDQQGLTVEEQEENLSFVKDSRSEVSWILKKSAKKKAGKCYQRKRKLPKWYHQREEENRSSSQTSSEDDNVQTSVSPHKSVIQSLTSNAVEDLDCEEICSIKSFGSQLKTPQRFLEATDEEEDDLERDFHIPVELHLRNLKGLASDIDLESENSQDTAEEEIDNPRVRPRKLFKEKKIELRQTREASVPFDKENSTISSLENNGLDNIDPGISRMVSAFGIDIQGQMQAKKKHLESVTKSVLKSTQKQINQAWLDQQDYRSQVIEEFQDALYKEIQLLEKDVCMLEQSEQKTMAFIKHQLKILENFKNSQEGRVKNLWNMKEKFSKHMVKAEKFSLQKQASLKETMKENIGSLQKSLLLENQKNELANLKKSLQSMFMT